MYNALQCKRSVGSGVRSVHGQKVAQGTKRSTWSCVTHAQYYKYKYKYKYQPVQPSSWSGLILHYNITVQKIEIHYKIQISLKIQKISTNTKYEQLYKVAKGISECDTQHGRCLDRSCVTYSYVTHTCSCVTHTHDFVT